MALIVEKWHIPFLEKPCQGDLEEDFDEPVVSHYKIGSIWVEVTTYSDFSGDSTEIDDRSYERIDEPDLSGAKLLGRKKVKDVGDSNHDIATYIHYRFTRPRIVFYAGLIEEVIEGLRLPR